jgi:protocatechuate 3,4-dioxygenase beta subunit
MPKLATIVPVFLVTFAVAIAPPTYAASKLRLSDGVTTVTITDGQPGDFSPLDGTVLYAGPVGANWFTVVAAGVTKPSFGSPTNPFLDLSFQASSRGGGTLTAEFSDNDFLVPAIFAPNIVGTMSATTGTVNYDVWTDPGNMLFAHTIPVATIGPMTPNGIGHFAGSASGPGGQAAPYSLTQVLKINHDGAGTTTFDAALPSTPSPLGAIGDYVWRDDNGNGVQDGGEPFLVGVPVTLSGTVSASTTTDGSGKYLFTGLPAGNYQVTFGLPSGGYAFTIPNAGSDDAKDSDASTATGQTGVYTLAAGETNLTVDAGVILLSSICGYVYYDANNNGIFEGSESPIANVAVTLSGTDDLGQVVNIPGMTGANGQYCFINLRPGTYTITETQPIDYLDGKDTQGTPGTGTVNNDQFTAITLAAGVHGQNNNFGELKAAALGDRVWHDLNENGIQDAGEPGVAGVKVDLYTCPAGDLVGTTTTDANGIYGFAGLMTGDYSVRFVLPTGYAFTEKDQGSDDAKDSDADVVTGRTICTTLVAGESDVTWDAGLVVIASICGHVYHDVNDNGIFEASESGIENVTVTLSGTDDLGQSVSATTQTAGNGRYCFDSLRPGTYTITETQPAGYNDGKDTQGTPGTGTTLNDQFANIILHSGVHGDHNNFGELKPVQDDHGGCRTTGGGRQETSFPRVLYVTHGGQVGAPVGTETAFTPDSACIHGNWEHVRHEKGGTDGNFHAKSYDSLMCACLGCPEDPNAPVTINGLCNPGARTCGPEPRKAPANKITFSGVGDYALTKGNRTPRSVLFRVDLEDRSEPGNSHAGGSEPPHDRHRIRIWILTAAELARLNNPSDRLLDFRQKIAASATNVPLKDGAILANGNPVPNGAAVFGVRAPDIDDGGEMTHGNHQIHPSIKDCP